LLLLLQAAKLLVGAGADVNMPWTQGSLKGMPPLLYAAIFGNIEIIEALVGKEVWVMLLQLHCKRLLLRTAHCCT
jgi:hypothetical protein